MYSYFGNQHYYNGLETSKDWEARIKAPDMKIADYYQEGNIRHFHLVAEPIKHNILSNITLDVLGYNGQGILTVNRYKILKSFGYIDL